MKNHLHEMIDKIEDIRVLNEIDGLINDVLLIDEDKLNSDSRLKLEAAITEGLNQVNEGDFITYEEFRKKHAKWFPK